MIPQLKASRPALLPPARDGAGPFLPWILALCVYAATLAGCGFIALRGSLEAAQSALGAALTLQVPADASSGRLDTIIATLRQTKGVVSEHVFEPAETARLLEPWLGPSVPLEELPVPRLIDIRIDPAAPPDLEKLRRELAAILPQARLDDHLAALLAVRAPARRIEIVLLAVIVAGLLLTAVTTMFAARAAVRIAGAEFRLLHLLGASDRDLATRFGWRHLRLGLGGGAVGAAAAAATLAALQQTGAVIQLPAPSGIGSLADWRLWAVLGAGAIAAGLVAMAVAHWVVLRWLGRLP
ncbi:MAG: cell division protein FtsX [Thiohalocapsa sp.]